jgi:type IV pilus assembly protein PilQ
MRIGKALLGLALLSGLWAAWPSSTVLAQESSAMSTVGLQRTGSGTFTLDVEGADIRTVIRAIAEFSGRNILVSPNVKGTVRVSLRNVGWQEAMRVILRSNGLDYTEDGSIIRIDDATKLYTEAVERETARSKALELVPLETRIVKINYAAANELQAPIQSALTRRGTVQTERRTNSLIITDVSSVVESAERMARELDSQTPQIEITAKIVDVDVDALRGIGIEWNLGGYADDADGMEFFDGTPPIPPQLIQPGNDPDQGLGADHNTTVPNPTTTISYGIFKDWGSLEAKLTLLESNRKANIISNPRITTVDNREAKILVGQKIPLIVQDVAGNPVSQLQTIGIQLRVTPHLTDDKKIIMDLHPEVSDLSSQSTVQGGVIINTSEADTRVMVDDGQTAVIGGLIRTNQGVVRTGVPILKDIPLVGLLFRSDNTVRQNRELIIFVTPRLVSEMASN